MNRNRINTGNWVLKGGYAVIACLILAYSPVLMAQEPAPAESTQMAGAEAAANGKDGAGKAKTREWIGADQKKVVEITFDEEKVYGKVQKPGVDYLISQGEASYMSIPLDRNIVEELKASLDGSPF